MRRLLVHGLPSATAGLLLAACATQPDPGYYSAPGFFMGILHGLIAPVALVVGIVTDVRIYAFPNTGWWYDFGYMLGLTAWAGSGATAAGRHGR